MRVRLIFHGRKVGAIGISGFHVVDLNVADDTTPGAMRLRAYDTHEHIGNMRIINRDTGKEIS